MSEQSRREFLMIASIAGIAGAAGLAEGVVREADAEPMDGRWEVDLRWHGRSAVQVIWTLDGGGTFSSSDGYGGTWARSGSLVLLSVRSETHPAFAGTGKGQSIQNGLALQPGGIRGFWSARRLP